MQGYSLQSKSLPNSEPTATSNCVGFMDYTHQASHGQEEGFRGCPRRRQASVRGEQGRAAQDWPDRVKWARTAWVVTGGRVSSCSILYIPDFC